MKKDLISIKWEIKAKCFICDETHKITRYVNDKPICNKCLVIYREGVKTNE